MRRHLSLAVCLLGICAFGFAAADTPAGPGKDVVSEAALVGIFYDLKQDPQHHATGMDPPKYSEVADEFLAKGWDEQVLSRYYQVSKPLHTTQIFIPVTNSGEAPKVFDLGNLATPNLWIVHYKAEVSPPEAGTYRFVGSGDDILAVAVNGKTVLATFSEGPGTKFHWAPSEPDGPRAGSFLMAHGDWMTFKADDIIDLDVIFGDQPGAVFDAFLMIEKKGAIYKMDSTGHPILPIFQVAPYNTPVNGNPNIQPPFATGFPIWKSHQ